MIEKNSTLVTIEKIKSFAIALVGAGIFSMGSTYFSEQASYRVPRILLPVYEIFGNIGLAVGMLILGAGLMYFAYKKFTKNEGKSMYLLVFLVIAVLGFYGIIFSTSSKSTSIEDIKASIEEGQKKTQDEIMNTEKPSLDNDLANKYLDKLEALEKKFEKAINETDKTKFDACEKEYDTVTAIEFGNVVKEISTMPEYKDFAMYNAKILDKIQVFRSHKW
ncbi:DUF5353 domain-containing protein [Sphingobacterium sp. SRCM116780]|uniref:DUF5353 domain-containing protein n=1 Tax=Sphingobacterium sp. SRCM116780 TaxID=2907623 RepID=UPI001F310F45|nr:DUF5353 domain-containing protein [Sphingobacterium sp. SRCM116780]UIR54931.1 DUF5353 domain-containing protein [Sphingobacterium sp. SRCM116780]